MYILAALGAAAVVLTYLSYGAYVGGDFIKCILFVPGVVLALWAFVERARNKWYSRENPYL